MITSEIIQNNEYFMKSGNNRVLKTYLKLNIQFLTFICKTFKLSFNGYINISKSPFFNVFYC